MTQSGGIELALFGTVADLVRKGKVGDRVTLLATTLITHAEVDRASAIGDIWRLIQFWSDLLDE